MEDFRVKNERRKKKYLEIKEGAESCTQVLDGSKADIRDIITTAISDWMDNYGVHSSNYHSYFIKKSIDRKNEIVLEFSPAGDRKYIALHLSFVNANVNQMWVKVAECLAEQLEIDTNSVNFICQLYSERFIGMNPPVTITTLKDMFDSTSKYFYLPYCDNMIKLRKSNVNFMGEIGSIEQEYQPESRFGARETLPKVMLRGVVNKRFEPIMGLCSNCSKISLFKDNNFILTYSDFIADGEQSHTKIANIPFVYRDGETKEFPRLYNPDYKQFSDTTILIIAQKSMIVYDVMTHCCVSPVFTSLASENKYPNLYRAERVVTFGESRSILKCYIDTLGAIKSGVSYTHKPDIEPSPVSNRDFEHFAAQTLEDLKVIEARRLEDLNTRETLLSLTLPKEVLEKLESNTGN